MYKITRTIFVCRNGEKEHSSDVVNVADLEEYRRSIKEPRHVRINFVYQTIPDDEHNRENNADKAAEGTEEPGHQS